MSKIDMSRRRIELTLKYIVVLCDMSIGQTANNSALSQMFGPRTLFRYIQRPANNFLDYLFSGLSSGGTALTLLIRGLGSVQI